MTLRFLESHLVMVPMEPRKDGCSVVEGKDITTEKVGRLVKAADDCWNGILAHNLEAFAKAYKDSFDAQVAMFPGMVNPVFKGHPEIDGSYIRQMIEKYSAEEDVVALKMPGAGGGGYLALVVKDSKAFCDTHSEAIELHIRRQ